jgi:hypothetical protein
MDSNANENTERLDIKEDNIAVRLSQWVLLRKRTPAGKSDAPSSNSGQALTPKFPSPLLCLGYPVKTGREDRGGWKSEKER